MHAEIVGVPTFAVQMFTLVPSPPPPRPSLLGVSRLAGGVTLGYFITEKTDNIYTACLVGIGLCVCGVVMAVTMLPKQLLSCKEIQALALED